MNKWNSRWTGFFTAASWLNHSSRSESPAPCCADVRHSNQWLRPGCLLGACERLCEHDCRRRAAFACTHWRYSAVLFREFLMQHKSQGKDHYPAWGVARRANRPIAARCDRDSCRSSHASAFVLHMPVTEASQAMRIVGFAIGGRSTTAVSPPGLRVGERGSAPLAIMPRMSYAFARAARAVSSPTSATFIRTESRCPAFLRSPLDNECFAPFAHKHHEARQIGVAAGGLRWLGR